MTKIPYNTERAVPQDDRLSSVPVAVADTSAVPKAINQLGASLEKIGEAAMQIKDREDKFNYSIAYSKFLQKSIDFQNDLEQDPDYKNTPQKYKEGLQKIKEETLQELGSNSHAESLKQQMNLYEAKNYGPILKNTVQKQRAESLAQVDRQVDANFQAFAKTNDPQAKLGLMASSITAFSNAIPDSDPDKAVKVQDFTNKIEKRGALLDLAKKTPAQQIALLKQEDAKSGSNITKYLTPEERMAAMQQAQQSQKQQNEQSITAIRNADFLRKRNAELEANDIVIHGGNIKDLPIEKYILLDQETKNRLNKTAEIYSGTIQISEEDSKSAFYKFLDMYHKDPEGFAKVDPTAISSSMSKKDASTVFGWQQKANAGLSAPIDLTTYNKVANQTLNSIGIGPTNKKAIPFKNRLSEEVEYFKQDHKRTPNQKELEQMAHSLVVQATFDAGMFSAEKTKRVYEVSRENIPKQIVVPEEFKTQVLELRKQKGYTSPVGEDYFKKLYLENLKTQ